MNWLIDALGSHLCRREDNLLAFAEHGVQVEGWLKGELLVVLNSIRAQGSISNFEREVRLPDNTRVDFVLQTPEGEAVFLETKHWLIGCQKGTFYDAPFYFGDKSSVGILPDVKKLSRVSQRGTKHLLVLCTCAPSEESWSAGLAKFNSRFAPYRILSRAAPPVRRSHYLGLLDVCALEGMTSQNGRLS